MAKKKRILFEIEATSGLSQLKGVYKLIASNDKEALIKLNQSVYRPENPVIINRTYFNDVR